MSPVQALQDNKHIQNSTLKKSHYLRDTIFTFKRIQLEKKKIIASLNNPQRGQIALP